MTQDAVNTKLRVLDLSRNILYELEASKFSRLVGLARLDLQENFALLEMGAFRGLVNLQDVNLSGLNGQIELFDLGVLGNELSLANLRFINLSNVNLKIDNLSSAKRDKLFAHCRHRIVVQAKKSSRTNELLEFLEKKSRILLILLKRDNELTWLNVDLHR
jgi:hypothetical protein